MALENQRPYEARGSRPPAAPGTTAAAGAVAQEMVHGVYSEGTIGGSFGARCIRSICGFLLIVAYGRAENGVAEVRAAAALDPLSPYVNTELGHALLLAGRYHEAAEQLRKAISLDPTRARPHNLLVSCPGNGAKASA